MTADMKGNSKMKRIILNIGMISLGAISWFQGTAEAQVRTTTTYNDVEAVAKKEMAQQKMKDADDAMEKGDYTTACQMYAESNDLVPDFKTEYALVQCLVKLGLYADAYYRMEDVAARAPDRDSVQWAHEEAQKIKDEAPCISINISEKLRAITDLEVTLDGAVLPRASWNDACLPVNCGTHNIRASAPQTAWNPQQTLTLVPGRHYVVALGMPRSLPPPPVPPTMVNPVKPAAFAIPSGIATAVGLIGLAMIAVGPDEKDRRALEIVTTAGLFAGGLGFTTGLIVYGTAKPVPQYATARAGVVNIGAGFQGRF